MIMSFAVISGIAVAFAIADGMIEAQRMVIHNHQGLDNVGEDAARYQTTLKSDVLTVEVVEAVHRERIQAIIEFAVELFFDKGIGKCQIEIAGIDGPIELIGIARTTELGIIRGFPNTRLIVVLIDLELARKAFQQTFHWIDLAVETGIETQRVDLIHLDGEVLIVELTVFGEELVHSGHHATRELEVAITFHHQHVVVG